MLRKICTFFVLALLILNSSQILFGQNVVSGKIVSAATNEGLIGAGVGIMGTSEGVTIEDVEGTFSFETNQSFPIKLEVTYIGYVTKEVEVTKTNANILIALEEENIVINAIEIKGQRISEKQKAAPLTVESLDLLAIKETPSDNFYDGLGSLKGVDLTAASLGFKIINTRGFNSTSPVRSLQIIDGVDNQAPGLNFSLGNFLGTSELDVVKVDIVVGAASAFYGPNAFNGVISMETKNPFFQKGLAGSVKLGERNLVEAAVRYADAFKNKSGNDIAAFKLNLAYFKAKDWEADNYDPVYGTNTDRSNPGGYDAVNIYGDEYRTNMDLTKSELYSSFAGLGQWHRKGYKESDLVDYNTNNLKANLAFHIRTNPSKKAESPEFIFSNSFSTGTTVYQGDNRFSLRGIQFFQSRLEFRKTNKYFIRAYMTSDNAGESFDPYFTALRLQNSAKPNGEWSKDYNNFWVSGPRKWMDQMEYPKLVVFPQISFDREAALAWLANNQGKLSEWHQLAANAANASSGNYYAFFEPGTAQFDSEFKRISSSYNNLLGSGTRFYDNSKLYHVHGEYKIQPTFIKEITLGANYRLYTPNSRGTIFYDTADVKITNSEFGTYVGVEHEFLKEKLKLNATVRYDKNQNFDGLISPAASAVYKFNDQNILRLSFSSALRNPTLSDQYLYLNVGPAILAGNLYGVDSLISVASFQEYRNSLDPSKISYFNISGVKPEKVRSFEIGYRTTLFEDVFVDGSYYFSTYTDFLGYNIGIDAEFDPLTKFPTKFQVFRYASNSLEKVSTQGFSIGLSYFFRKYFQLAGNYSFNKLASQVNDPIIPAFNTPEHKYNLSLSGRNIKWGVLKDFGFSLNYKWIDGFLFEGSPQFTGFIPSYSLLDAQINYNFVKNNLTLKIGASNVLNNKVFQTYGGPRIGRMAYISVLYDFKKKVNI